MKFLLIHILFLFMIASSQAQSRAENNEKIGVTIKSENPNSIEDLKGSDVNSLKLSIPFIGVVAVKKPTIEVQQLAQLLYNEKNIKEVETISYSTPEKKIN